jgi:hypothetical protein
MQETLFSQWTPTTIGDASSVDDAHGAILLCSPLLGIEWMVSGTAQRAIRLLGEIRSGKDPHSCCSRPL